MAQVNVTINGRSYQIACEDGQEAHLTRLGQYVDKRIGELVAAVGQVGDSRLLVMASLLVADELSDAYSELDGLKDGSANVVDAEEEERVCRGIEALAARLETLAERLERT